MMPGDLGHGTDQPVRHLDTAFDWHGGETSPLYEFAETGSIRPQLSGEIRDCLAAVHRGAIAPGTDPVVERERLLALLRHVELDVAICQARLIGREHGGSAADWWYQDALGGRATVVRAAVARRMTLGMHEGDPAVLAELPGLNPDYGRGELEDDCSWEEPLDDPQARERWAAGRDLLWEAYESAFNDTVTRTVASQCRTAVVDAHLERIGARRVDTAVLELTPPDPTPGIKRLDALRREGTPGAGLGDPGVGL